MEELSLYEIQQQSFKVLEKIKEIFTKNNWQFYLAYGTLIGAVRHQGFIPWDDDIDIWVPRKDYESFINYCISHKDELYPFQLLNFRTVSKYPYAISRFSDARYSVDYFGANNYGLGLFVDIYPLDDINPNNLKFCAKQTKRIKNILHLTVISSKRIKNVLKKIYKPIFLLLHLKTSVSSYINYVDKKAQKYNGKGYKFVAVNSWVPEYAYKKTDMQGDKNIEFLFNNVLMPVPYNYDKILRQQYGDYMKLPPKEEQVGHHYYKAYVKNN